MSSAAHSFDGRGAGAGDGGRDGGGAGRVQVGDSRDVQMRQCGEGAQIGAADLSGADQPDPQGYGAFRQRVAHAMPFRIIVSTSGTSRSARLCPRVVTNTRPASQCLVQVTGTGVPRSSGWSGSGPTR